MDKPKNIALVAFDGVQVLDITGPAAVFSAANDALGRESYRVHILSAEGGVVQSNSAVRLETKSIKDLSTSRVDTLMIAGGDAAGLRKLAANALVMKWVVKASAQAIRFGSICTGAFLLADFGLIDGKRVATHWSACSALAQRYPKADVDANALYVQDGRLWTSAGVTTGIDMCLQMVNEDLGKEITNAIAKRLVLYARRPGYQAQFSSILSAQIRADSPFADLIEWMRKHLTEELNISRMASHVAMSERSFHRKFTASVGETPAHFIETLRLEKVRYLLTSGITLKEVAAKTGYATSSQLSKAFDRRFGMTPLLFRSMHSTTG